MSAPPLTSGEVESADPPGMPYTEGMCGRVWYDEDEARRRPYDPPIGSAPESAEGDPKPIIGDRP
jgi:hypothetical protein